MQNTAALQKPYSALPESKAMFLGAAGTAAATVLLGSVHCPEVHTSASEPLENKPKAPTPVGE